MTTSPVHTQTALDIVTEAALVLGVADRERPITADIRQAGFNALNNLVKSLQVTYHLWTDTEAIIVLEQGVDKYPLGPNGSHAADVTDFRNYTVLSSSSGTTLNVSGSISINDNVGVFLNDGTLFWSTASNVVGTVVTLTDSLPSTVNAGNLIYVYTNKIPRPIKVVNSRYRTSLTGSDTPTTKWNRTQYFESQDKSTQGSVMAWYYSPQLTDGNLYVFKTPSSDSQILKITYTRPLYITDANGDLVDFPSEWFLPLVYMLANALLPQFPAPDQLVMEIKNNMNMYAELVGLPPLGKLQPIPEAGRS